MDLVCHVVLQDHVIKRSCDFIGKTHQGQLTFLPRLLVIGTLVVEMLLVCNVTFTW